MLIAQNIKTLEELHEFISQIPNANPLTPRFILKQRSSDNKVLYQCNSKIQVDITDVKFYWNIDGEEVMMTIDELEKLP